MLSADKLPKDEPGMQGLHEFHGISLLVGDPFGTAVQDFLREYLASYSLQNSKTEVASADMPRRRDSGEMLDFRKERKFYSCKTAAFTVLLVLPEYRNDTITEEIEGFLWYTKTIIGQGGLDSLCNIITPWELLKSSICVAFELGISINHD